MPRATKTKRARKSIKSPRPVRQRVQKTPVDIVARPELIVEAKDESFTGPGPIHRILSMFDICCELMSWLDPDDIGNIRLSCRGFDEVFKGNSISICKQIMRNREYTLLDIDPENAHNPPKWCKGRHCLSQKSVCLIGGLHKAVERTMEKRFSTQGGIKELIKDIYILNGLHWIIETLYHNSQELYERFESDFSAQYDEDFWGFAKIIISIDWSERMHDAIFWAPLYPRAEDLQSTFYHSAFIVRNHGLSRAQSEALSKKINPIKMHRYDLHEGDGVYSIYTNVVRKHKHVTDDFCRELESYHKQREGFLKKLDAFKLEVEAVIKKPDPPQYHLSRTTYLNQATPPGYEPKLIPRTIGANAFARYCWLCWTLIAVESLEFNNQSRNFIPTWRESSQLILTSVVELTRNIGYNGRDGTMEQALIAAGVDFQTGVYYW